MRKRVMSHKRGNVRELSGFGLQKFLAGGRIKEEIAHDDRCPHGQASLFDFENLATINLDDRPRGLIGGARFEMQARD
jgi:hypothetical protein